MQAKVLDRVAPMSANGDWKAMLWRESYKSCFNRRVNHVLQFEGGYWVYANSPSNLSSPIPSNHASTKLRPRTAELYEVERVHSRTVFVTKNRLLNTISTDTLLKAKQASKGIARRFKNWTSNVTVSEDPGESDLNRTQVRRSKTKLSDMMWRKALQSIESDGTATM